MTTFNPQSDGQASQLFDMIVAELRLVADGVVAIEVAAPDGADLPIWEPGAHIDLLLPNGLVRQYSLCGEPARRDRWRIAVLREPSSRGGSSWLHDQLRVGQRISVAAPRNNFRVVDAEHYLFVAGGIGITPILPMVRSVAAKGKQWTLLYGGRSRRSMAFLDEIKGFQGGTSHIVPQDEFGLLDLDSFLGRDRPDTVVYCCGPTPLIEAVEQRCHRWRPDALHLERFSPSKKAQSREKGSFEVELARSGRRIVVPPHRSILDVLEENGCKVTNSCRAGICGTCLVKVLSGIPEHNDDVLSLEEQEAGDAILVCVSRAKSDRLLLDL